VGIGIGLQRKGRDMSKLKYLIDGKADEQFENMLWCFGGGDPDDTGGGGGGDVSDEDLDEDLQQDIAAAAVFKNQGSKPLGGYSYMLPDDDDTNYMVAATADVLANAANAPRDQMQGAIDKTTQAIANNYPQVGQAIQRAAGISPNIVMDMDDPAGDYMLLQRGPADISVGSSNMPPAVITDVNGRAFNTTTGELIPPLGDPYDELPPSPAELFRAQESQRAMGLDQRQAGYDAYQAMLNDAVGAAQSNIDNASGLLGGATKFMNQKFIDGMNTRIGGRDSEAYQLYLNDPNLFSPVYNAGGRLTGYRDEFGRLTGTDPLNQSFGNDDDGNDVVAPVANPMTGTERCPDGYTFDEDLQACRRKTKRELQADSGTGGGSSTASGDMFYRRTSLDDAPANLPSGFNFADANRNFTQSFAFRPGFYSNPMDTTGFTKLL
jgi:hypothetical protein